MTPTHLAHHDQSYGSELWGQYGSMYSDEYGRLVSHMATATQSFLMEVERAPKG